ncbi:hypothetical protein KFE25_013932 [Diacronema lutheri]|uniref:F5/8 type C domain-containing protein n=2 Tax=Diacronema lutheri TaxID=2081491 RepID=A0A8J5X8R3_DIALT|nr:hypothetical protein KFE25_013932 [Diacronema lutheri]
MAPQFAAGAMLVWAACACVGATADASECYTRNDRSDYRGTVSVTVRNSSCMRWSDVPTGDELARLSRHVSLFPSGYDPDALGLGEHNYCRRAGRDTFACAWCFIERPPAPPPHPPPSPAPAARRPRRSRGAPRVSMGRLWECCDVGLPSQSCGGAGAPATAADGRATLPPPSAPSPPPPPSPALSSHSAYMAAAAGTAFLYARGATCGTFVDTALPSARDCIALAGTAAASGGGGATSSIGAYGAGCDDMFAAFDVSSGMCGWCRRSQLLEEGGLIPRATSNVFRIAQHRRQRMPPPADWAAPGSAAAAAWYDRLNAHAPPGAPGGRPNGGSGGGAGPQPRAPLTPEAAPDTPAAGDGARGARAQAEHLSSSLTCADGSRAFDLARDSLASATSYAESPLLSSARAAVDGSDTTSWLSAQREPNAGGGGGGGGGARGAPRSVGVGTCDSLTLDLQRVGRVGAISLLWDPTGYARSTQPMGSADGQRWWPLTPPIPAGRADAGAGEGGGGAAEAAVEAVAEAEVEADEAADGGADWVVGNALDEPLGGGGGGSGGGGVRYVRLDFAQPAGSSRRLALLTARVHGCALVDAPLGAMPRQRDVLPLPRAQRESGAWCTPHLAVDLAASVGRAFASSAQSSWFRAGNALDGAPATRWASAYPHGNYGTPESLRAANQLADREWVAVDLRGPHELIAVDVLWGAAHAREYAIDISADGYQWEEAARERRSHGYADAWLSTRLLPGAPRTPVRAGDAGAVAGPAGARAPAAHDAAGGADGARAASAHATGDGRVVAQFVRVRGVSRASAYGFSVRELQVRGCALPPLLPAVPAPLVWADARARAQTHAQLALADGGWFGGWPGALGGGGGGGGAAPASGSAMGGAMGGAAQPQQPPAGAWRGRLLAPHVSPAACARGGAPAEDVAAAFRAAGSASSSRVAWGVLHAPERALDGDSGTSWESKETALQRLHFDLRASCALTAVRVLWANGAAAHSYDVLAAGAECSPPARVRAGVSPPRAADAAGAPGPSAGGGPASDGAGTWVTTVLPAGTRARHVQLALGTAEGRAGYFGVLEVEILGCCYAPAQTPPADALSASSSAEQGGSWCTHAREMAEVARVAAAAAAAAGPGGSGEPNAFSHESIRVPALLAGAGLLVASLGVAALVRARLAALRLGRTHASSRSGRLGGTRRAQSGRLGKSVRWADQHAPATDGYILPYARLRLAAAPAPREANLTAGGLHGVAEGEEGDGDGDEAPPSPPPPRAYSDAWPRAQPSAGAASAALNGATPLAGLPAAAVAKTPPFATPPESPACAALNGATHAHALPKAHLNDDQSWSPPAVDARAHAPPTAQPRAPRLAHAAGGAAAAGGARASTCPAPWPAPPHHAGAAVRSTAPAAPAEPPLATRADDDARVERASDASGSTEATDDLEPRAQLAAPEPAADAASSRMAASCRRLGIGASNAPGGSAAAGCAAPRARGEFSQLM